MSIILLVDRDLFIIRQSINFPVPVIREGAAVGRAVGRAEGLPAEPVIVGDTGLEHRRLRVHRPAYTDEVVRCVLGRHRRGGKHGRQKQGDGLHGLSHRFVNFSPWTRPPAVM